MKFKNPFKREKAQAKNEKTHPPEERIACPLCGHEYWTRSMLINSIVAEYYKVPDWLARLSCSWCLEDFWIVGSYNEIKGTKPIGT